MKLLRDVDGDEISLVNRAANRRKFLLLKGDTGMENDLSDILESPWESEGSLIDAIRKDGVQDENIEKAVIAAVRLLKGVEGEFSPELIEKLGTELYPRKNPPLNGPGVPSPGGLVGAAGSEEDCPPDGSASGADTDASVSGDSLEGTASGAKVAADAEPDEDDQKGKKGFFGRKSKTQKEEVAPEDVAKEDVSVTDDERGTVETHAVPVQKEDGSWDFTDVPDDSAAFFRAMIQKQDEQATELAAAKEAVAKADDTLLSRQMIEKASRLNHVAAPDDLAPILKEASLKLDSESFEKLTTVLEAAQERISKGGLFTEMGSRSFGPDTSKTDADSQLIAKAQELVEKGGDITFEAAYSKAMEQNPDLYNQYMSEHGMGV